MLKMKLHVSYVIQMPSLYIMKLSFFAYDFKILRIHALIDRTLCTSVIHVSFSFLLTFLLKSAENTNKETGIRENPIPYFFSAWNGGLSLIFYA